MEVLIRLADEEKDNVIALVSAQGIDFEIAESNGFDGQALIDLVLQYGPDTLALITSIIKLVKELRAGGKNNQAKITIDLSR